MLIEDAVSLPGLEPLLQGLVMHGPCFPAVELASQRRSESADGPRAQSRLVRRFGYRVMGEDQPGFVIVSREVCMGG